ncbi:MAG: hypothetical protein C0616_03230 [Desulfuromonas sp.]|nr:MAG: hypothetical protein C0616_03230 [Desulfuromonas sp.]
MAKSWIRILCCCIGCLLCLLPLGCGSDTEEDLTPPDLTFSGTSSITTNRFHQLSGTVDPGSTIEILIDSEEVYTEESVDGDTWSAEIELEEGSHVVLIRASDEAGNVRGFQFVLTYDVLSIDRYIDVIADGTVGQQIGGLFDPSAANVPVIFLGEEDPGTEVDVDGDIWSYSLENLPEGTTTVTLGLDHADLGLVEKTVEIEVDGDAPLISLEPAIESVTLPSLVVSGNVDAAASSVTVTPTPLEGAAVLDGAGSWSGTISILPVGKSSLSASVNLNGVIATAHGLLLRGSQFHVVNQLSPADGATGVDVAADVAIGFGRAMNGETLTSETVELSDQLGLVTATVEYDEETQILTLAPQADLDPNSDYQVRLTTDVSDIDGNPLPAELIWSFQTGE